MVGINTGNPIGSSVQGDEISIPSEADGDILIRSTNWIRLAKGSDGEFLKLASGLPSWGGGGALNLLTATNAVAASSVNFPSLTEADAFLLVFRIFTAQASTNFNMKLNDITGSAYSTTHMNATGSGSQDTGQASCKLGDISNSDIAGMIFIAGRCDQNDQLLRMGAAMGPGGGGQEFMLGGSCDLGASADAVDRIEVQLAAGTFTGSVNLYSFSE